MILLVSTVKDTVADLRRFVSGNLANGIDHLVVCLDAPEAPDQQEAAAFLEHHDHVSVVCCDDAWWTGKRPASLNARQRVNANVVKAVLSRLDWAEWLFHLDGDEVALLDRSVIDALPQDVTTIRLAPWESVALEDPDADPDWFKRPPSADELALLQALGVIERPHAGLYFHGHTSGKSGIRPSLDRWLAVHFAQEADESRSPEFSHPALRHLHYESCSADEFVRKWTNLLTSGSRPSMRGERERLEQAIDALLGADLSPDVRRHYLREVYRRRVVDDLPTLRDLRLVERIRPAEGGHLPQPLAPRQRARLDALLDHVHAQPKPPYVRQSLAARARRLVADWPA